MNFFIFITDWISPFASNDNYIEKSEMILRLVSLVVFIIIGVAFADYYKHMAQGGQLALIGIGAPLILFLSFLVINHLHFGSKGISNRPLWVMVGLISIMVIISTYYWWQQVEPINNQIYQQALGDTR